MGKPMTPKPGAGARERILNTAYELFCREGVQAVGVDRVTAQADVAKTTLYRHFPSKQDLVLAVLELREERWTIDWLVHEVEQRAEAPDARLLAFFDVFDEWFRRRDYEACLFINTMLESHDPDLPIHNAAVAALANVRSVVRRLAEEAGVADPDAFAHTWQILLAGSIVHATQGIPDAALLARDAAALVLERATEPVI
jgi:AcrR family transcriptional regulator